MRKMSYHKIKKFLGEEDFKSVHALMELCRKNHPKGMHTNAGCPCGSSVGGGIECEGLGILLHQLQRIEWMEQRLESFGIKKERLEEMVEKALEKNEQLESLLLEYTRDV